MNLLWIDFETGGLKPGHHEPLSCAGMIEKNGNVIETFNLRLRPLFMDRLDAKALEVNGFTLEQVAAFPPAKEGYGKLLALIKRHAPRGTKLTVAGHNVAGFDRQFLNELFLSNNDGRLHWYVDYHCMDTMSVAAWLRYAGLISPADLKLGTLCEYFGIPLIAHDAMNDVTATRLLAIAMRKIIGNGGETCAAAGAGGQQPLHLVAAQNGEFEDKPVAAANAGGKPVWHRKKQ